MPQFLLMLSLLSISHAKSPKLDWEALDAEAATAVAMPPFAKAESVTRLDDKASYVMHPAPVQAGTCYRVAVAWSSGTQTLLTIGMAGDNPGDPSPNQAFESRTVTAETSPLSVTLCADHPGTAYITLNQTSAIGFVKTNAKLQYAVAISSHAEDAATAATRRQQENAKAEAIRAWMDQNVERADAKQAAFDKVCDPCRAEWRSCSDTFASSETCRSQYNFCSQPVTCGAPYLD